MMRRELPRHCKGVLMMQTTASELSLRAQTLLDILREVLIDLAAELRKDYADVEIKLSIVAE
jgi:hypothetical protein